MADEGIFNKQLGRYIVSSGPVPSASSTTSSPHKTKHQLPSSMLSPSKSSVHNQTPTWQQSIKSSTNPRYSPVQRTLSTGFSVAQQPTTPADKPSTPVALVPSPSETNPPRKQQVKTVQQLLKKPTTCKYMGNGCKWTGEMEIRSEHISVCQYNPTSESIYVHTMYTLSRVD